MQTVEGWSIATWDFGSTGWDIGGRRDESCERENREVWRLSSCGTAPLESMTEGVKELRRWWVVYRQIEETEARYHS